MLRTVLVPLSTHFSSIMSGWVSIGSRRLPYSRRTQIAGSLTFGRLMANCNDHHSTSRVRFLDGFGLPPRLTGDRTRN